jgi:hypothetical protein
MKRSVLMGALLLAFAAPVAAAAVGPSARVSVTPGAGKTQTRFAFRFRLPAATGTFGTLIRSDAFSINGPRGAHCEPGLIKILGAGKKGKRVTLRLGPGKGRGGWCAGQWRGSIVQTESFRCNPGPTRACPELEVAPKTIASFRFRVKSAPEPPAPQPPAGDVPSFAGLISATNCDLPITPQVVPRSTGFTMRWDSATDPVTPSTQIVYDIFQAGTPGGEDYTTPTYTTAAGATTFTTPVMVNRGAVYFVVRARNAAGHEDTNTIERQGVASCAGPTPGPVHQPEPR